MSIFQTPSPGKATRTGQSVTPMSSHQDKPNIPDPMPSIRHVPNASPSSNRK